MVDKTSSSMIYIYIIYAYMYTVQIIIMYRQSKTMTLGTKNEWKCAGVLPYEKLYLCAL